MSLKLTIKDYLQKHKYLSLQNLDALCKQEQKKLSNGERRLRELMQTDPIVPIKNPAGAIIAYEHSGDIAPIQSPRHGIRQDGESQLPISPECCYSKIKFGTHDPHCLVLIKSKQVPQLTLL